MMPRRVKMKHDIGEDHAPLHGRLQVFCVDFSLCLCYKVIGIRHWQKADLHRAFTVSCVCGGGFPNIGVQWPATPGPNSRKTGAAKADAGEAGCGAAGIEPDADHGKRQTKMVPSTPPESGPGTT
jgi:hypothetical protein